MIEAGTSPELRAKWHLRDRRKVALIKQEMHGGYWPPAMLRWLDAEWVAKLRIEYSSKNYVRGELLTGSCAYHGHLHTPWLSALDAVRSHIAWSASTLGANRICCSVVAAFEVLPLSFSKLLVIGSAQNCNRVDVKAVTSRLGTPLNPQRSRQLLLG